MHFLAWAAIGLGVFVVGSIAVVMVMAALFRDGDQ